jgi:hypothetical protein
MPTFCPAFNSRFVVAVALLFVDVFNIRKPKLPIVMLVVAALVVVAVAAMVQVMALVSQIAPSTDRLNRKFTPEVPEPVSLKLAWSATVDPRTTGMDVP